MTDQEQISTIYHSLFHYTLTTDELKRWVAGPKLRLTKQGRATKVPLFPRPDRAVNKQKLAIAKNAAALLSKIPTILFVGVSGSLAMHNAGVESDIDFIIITKANTVWVSRILALLLLKKNRISVRSAGVKEEKDKICLNMWIDETKLAWHFSKNAYIAHEVAQVVPLVNKKHTYEQWMSENKWIFEYWPKAVAFPSQTMVSVTNRFTQLPIMIINILCFLFQKLYMRGKRTREFISTHEAHFHPFDWGERILNNLKAKGVSEHVI